MGYTISDLRGTVAFKPFSGRVHASTLRYTEEDQRWRSLGVTCDACEKYEERENYHCTECRGTWTDERGQYDLCIDCFKSGVSCPGGHTLVHRSVDDGETDFGHEGSSYEIEFFTTNTSQRRFFRVLFILRVLSILLISQLLTGSFSIVFEVQRLEKSSYV